MEYQRGFKRILAITLALWFLACWGKALMLAIEARELIDGPSNDEVVRGLRLQVEAAQIVQNSFMIPIYLSIGIWCVIWVLKWVYRGFKPQA